MSATTLQNLYLPRKLPPSTRDREIYELAVEKRVTQAELALRFGLSQGRIAQIVQKVEDWVHTLLGEADSPPPAAEEEGRERTPGERLELAEQIAYERVEFVYSQAMEAWSESRQDSSEIRTRRVGEELVEERITKSQTGKAGLLNQALRAALTSARLMGVDVTGRDKRKSLAQAPCATTNNRGEQQAESAAEAPATFTTCDENDSAPRESSGGEAGTAESSASAASATTNNCEDSHAKSRGCETRDEMMERLKGILARGVPVALESAA